MIIQNTEEELVKQLKNDISNKKYVLRYKYTIGSSNYLSNGAISFNILNKKNLIIYSGSLYNNKILLKVFKKVGIENIILDIHHTSYLKTLEYIFGTIDLKDSIIVKPYKSSNNSRMCIVIVNLKKINL